MNYKEAEDVGEVRPYLSQTVVDDGEVAYVGEVGAELEDCVGHLSVSLGLEADECPSLEIATKLLLQKEC